MFRSIMWVTSCLIGIASCTKTHGDGESQKPSSSMWSGVLSLLPTDRGELYGREVCSNWLITMLEIERQAPQSGSEAKVQYKFGTNDKKIRAEYSKMLQQYVDSGVEVKSRDFVGDNFPSFVGECAKTRRIEYDSCHPKAGDDPAKFQECAQEYVERFKMGVVLFASRSIKQNGYTDLGDYTDQTIQKLMREASVNPTSFLGH
jgi:hypothetical protein